MSWERRLREMVLAGGAFAAACSGTGATAGGDAASEDGSSSGMTSSGGSSGSTSSGGSSGVPSFCCNANGDPCCTYRYCDASLTPACAAELDCAADGGTFTFYTQPVTCSFGDASQSDSQADGALSDANTSDGHD